MNAPESRSDERPHYHFVTGKLAEHALRSVVAPLADRVGFDHSIGVMPITVAALMTPRWLVRHLNVPSEATAVILPGYCDSDVDAIQQAAGKPVRVGPRDLRDLPDFFGEASKRGEDYGAYSIEIIAEINHAPRLPLAELRAAAERLRGDGADVVDLGCDPAARWTAVGDAVRALGDLGLRVSIDTFDPWEAAEACRAGAELVLSVNQSNRAAAVDWGTEVVAIPDTPDDLASLDATVAWLAERDVPLRIDPILEPVGFGFAASLERYMTVRRRYPDAAMMMGIGNLTELTDVDSAGVNLMLLAVCEELGVDSVLTTEVINWARSSVRECDLARRMVHYACRHRVPPKRLDDSLVMLRDPRLRPLPPGTLASLAASIRDPNYRLFAEGEEIHLVSRGLHLADRDPFRLFARLMQDPHSRNVDPSHAFYLGFEMAKALTALTLGKQYEQDEALRWGHLTRPERHHRLPRRHAR